MQNVSEMVRYTLQQTLRESLGKAPRPQTDADAISSNQRFNLITCFMRVSMLSASDSFCFFIDIDEREVAALLDKSEATPIAGAGF